MDAFLKTLQTLPEVAELVSRVENGGCPAVLTVNWRVICKV